MTTKTSPSEKNFLKSSEVAKIFDVNPSTVFLWVKKGKLKPKKTLGGQFRFSRERIEKLIKRINAKQFEEKRIEERFEGNFMVVIKTVQVRAPRYNMGVVTDLSRSGVGLVVEDNNDLLRELGKGDVSEVTIMNYENPLFKTKTRGSIRHFKTAGAGKVAIGVALA